MERSSTIKIKNGSQYQKRYYKKHHKTILQKHKQYRENNRSIIRERDKQHYRDNKDYYRKKKSQRVRKLGFIKLVENDWNEPVDWHHVDDDHVVPIPRYLHKMCYTGDREKHRELCNKLIKILYGDIL